MWGVEIIRADLRGSEADAQHLVSGLQGYIYTSKLNRLRTCLSTAPWDTYCLTLTIVSRVWPLPSSTAWAYRSAAVSQRQWGCPHLVLGQKRVSYEQCELSCAELKVREWATIHLIYLHRHRQKESSDDWFLTMLKGSIHCPWTLSCTAWLSIEIKHITKAFSLKKASICFHNFPLSFWLYGWRNNFHPSFGSYTSKKTLVYSWSLTTTRQMYASLVFNELMPVFYAPTPRSGLKHHLFSGIQNKVLWQYEFLSETYIKALTSVNWTSPLASWNPR